MRMYVSGSEESTRSRTRTVIRNRLSPWATTVRVMSTDVSSGAGSVVTTCSPTGGKEVVITWASPTLSLVTTFSACAAAGARRARGTRSAARRDGARSSATVHLRAEGEAVTDLTGAVRVVDVGRAHLGRRGVGGRGHGSHAEPHPPRAPEAGRRHRQGHRVGAQVDLRLQAAALRIARTTRQAGDRLPPEPLDGDVVPPRRGHDAEERQVEGVPLERPEAHHHGEPPVAV